MAHLQTTPPRQVHTWQSSAEADRSRLARSLSKAMRESQSVQELCEVAAAGIHEELNTEFTCVRLGHKSQQVDETCGDLEWLPLCHALLIQNDAADGPQARLLDQTGNHQYATLLIPVDDSETIGAIACVMKCDSWPDVRQALQHLKSLSQLLGLAVDGYHDRSRHQITPVASLSTLSRSVSYDTVDEFCYAIANGLRVETDTDLVGVGLMDGHHVRLACISGLDDVTPDSPAGQLIRQSMEEAADARRPICIQYQSEGESTSDSEGHPLTSRWQQQTGASVVSVPLSGSSGECIAVVSVQGRSGQTLSEPQVRMITELSQPLTASINLMKSGHRSLFKHTLDSARRVSAAVCGPLRARVACSVLLMTALVGWMILGKTNYTVHTPCTIVAAETRMISAPWEAPLQNVLVRPGEMVQEGQLLAHFDTHRLEAEREQLQAELRAADIAVVNAARESVPALIGRAVSQRDIVEANLLDVEQRIASGDIRAPFAGWIISDDLVPRTGETLPMGEPLFELVPDGQLALEVDVPESALACVENGQPGSFALNASPANAYQCQLEAIEPSAQGHAGGNVVKGRARISNQMDWLRPGMQGVVQINTGERPVWWAWLHTVIDAVNHEVWSFTGVDVTAESNVRVTRQSAQQL